MKNYLKKQFNKLINCSFVFLLFLILFSVSVFSIKLNTCSITGEYYVDTNIYQNTSNISNWESFVNPINRSRDYNTFVSPYFSNVNTVVGSYSLNQYSRHTYTCGGVHSSSESTIYVYFSSSVISKEYYYGVGFATYSGYEGFPSSGTILFQINKTLLYSNLSQTFATNIKDELCAYDPPYNYSYVNIQGVVFTKLSYSPSPFIVNDNYLYIGSDDGNLYQLDVTNISNNISRFKTNNTINATPIYFNEYIYVVSNDKYVYQLNATNISRQIANFTFNQSIKSTLIADNNYLYVFTTKNILFKLNSSNINQVIQNVSYPEPPLYDPTIGMSENFTVQSPSLYRNFIYVTKGGYLYKFNTTNILNYEYVYYNITNSGYVPYGGYYATQRKLYNPVISNENIYVSTSTYPLANAGFLLQINSSNISKLLNYYSAIPTYPLDTFTDITIINGVGYVSSSTNCATIFGCASPKTFQFLVDNISNYIGQVNSSATTNSLILVYDNQTFINANSGYQLGIKVTNAFDNYYYPYQICPATNLVTLIYPIDKEVVNTNIISFVTYINSSVGVNSSPNRTIQIEFLRANNYNDGFGFRNLTYCYQESATILNQSGKDGICELNYNGSYSFSNGYNDGDFNTNIVAGGTYDVTYIKPKNSISATWFFKVSAGSPSTTIYYLSIPTDCWTYSTTNLTLRTQNVAQAQCYNGTAYKTIFDAGFSLYKWEEAINWTLSSNRIDFVSGNATQMNEKNTYSINTTISYFPFCWYVGLNDSINWHYSEVACFSQILGNCFDHIKNQDETDVDYNGICGYCKNLTFYSDDTPFQVLKESDLYTYPFNQSQCSQGNAVVGSYTFLILLITLGLFIVGGLVLFFFGIPILIFAITGSFKFSWWKLLFGGKKKQKEKEQDSSNDTYSN